MDFANFDISKLQDKTFMKNLEKSFNDTVDKTYNEKMECKCGSKVLCRNYEKHIKSKKHLCYEK